jgi:hypothetical protein
MIAIAGAVADLVANPRPILCLDTCDFLDVVRRFADSDPKEANLYIAHSFRNVADALATGPDRCQVIVTYLVLHEWGQNIEEARKKVDQYLGESDRRIDRIAEACGWGETAVPALSVRLATVSLTTSLVALAESLMNQALIIEKDAECVERALRRVMGRMRPSRKGEIKDSIHWEHYLELSRRLEAAGHTLARIFVGADKAAFWVNRETPTVHPDLDAEAIASGLRFFGRLDEALRTLGI